jgi:hypothetical protein
VCRRCSLRRSARPADPPPAAGPSPTTRPPPASPVAYLDLSPQRNSTFQPFLPLIPPLLVRVSPALHHAHAYSLYPYSAPSAPSSLTRLLTALLCPIVDLNICPLTAIPALVATNYSANYLAKYPPIRITQIAHPGVHHSIHSRPLRRAFPQPLVARLVRRARGNRPSPSSGDRLTAQFSLQYHVPAASIRFRRT